MKPPSIEVRGLTKDFKKVRAVDALSVSIPEGALFGLVGPDGAGKTTLLRLLAGLLYITEGEATVAGFDLREESEAIKKQIGYMAQQFSLYGELSVVENLRFFAEMYEVPREAINARMERLLAFAGLTEFKSRWAALLSGGMQKKLALACTLIHEPKILLLDEPTTGVDPVSRREFWNILTELHVAGTTIVVSTPYMDEADRCSIVGLMYEGKMVECASPQDIRAKMVGEIIELRTDEWRRTLPIIKKMAGVLEVQTYGEALHILVDDAEAWIPLITEQLITEGLSYRSIRKSPARMEEAFISLIGRYERMDKDPSMEM